MGGILYVTGALADGTVTTAKLADDAVDADKLANSINSAIAANTAKTSNATHTGDVTGSTSLTIADNAVTTAKIANEAVTLAKLPHGTSSNDGKFLRANNGADPTFESLPSSGLPLTGGTLTGTLSGQHINPSADDTYDLGTSSLRWANIYTTDLQLSNEGKANEVDGTWGDWTIQEGESDLFLKNNRSGKKYKFNLTEVS